MFSKSLNTDRPLSLTLAADTRLSQTNYIDDHIWELRIGGGEPPALALETTYGLRANRMRIFPRFLKPAVDRTNPANFHAPVRVQTYYPNYLSLTFAPFEGLHITAEYWVPESQVIAGRFKITNQSILPQSFRLELAALLNPRDNEGNFDLLQTDLGQVMSGETSNLKPIISLAGGTFSTTGPFPALAIDMEMYPGSHRTFIWVNASMRSHELSLAAGKKILANSWDASITRVDMQNISDMVHISTGNEEWDQVLILSQKISRQMVMQNWPYLPAASFILSRRPDQGFSTRGDGSDHPTTWKGQTVFDSYYMANLLLPGSPTLVQGFIRNFMATQSESGFIDWRVGLGGQRTQRLAQPMLATLAVQVAPYLDEESWYRELYPGLKRFFKNWTNPFLSNTWECPKWENAFQSAIEDSPIFDKFSGKARGVDSILLESPSLMAMLFREAASLAEMARVLGVHEDLPEFNNILEQINHFLAGCWNQSSGLYQYSDSLTHISHSSTSITSFQGQGSFTTRRSFKHPRRIIIRLETREERTYAVTVKIYGISTSGYIEETLPPRSFSWRNFNAYGITQNVFLAINRVEIQGLTDKDRVKFYTPDFSIEDCSLMLPLWAGVMDKKQVKQLVENKLHKRFMQPHGIPISPGHVENISMPWNILIGEGLLQYGYQNEAAEICSRLINTAVQSFKHHGAFYQYYHSHSGQPIGDQHHLYGLPSLGFFLQTLGIRYLHPKKISIDGFNPYPHPVTVQYHKVVLNCCSDHTEILFPTGQQVIVDRPGVHRVTIT